MSAESTRTGDNMLRMGLRSAAQIVTGSKKTWGFNAGLLCLVISFSQMLPAQQSLQYQPLGSDSSSRTVRVPVDQPVASPGTSTLKTYSVPSQMIGTVGAHLQLKYHQQPGVTVTTDPTTGQLMVMAPPAIQTEVDQAIRRLIETSGVQTGDQGKAALSQGETTYQLANLTWRELEDALGRLVGSKLAVTTERNGELAQLKIQNQHGVHDVLRIDRRANHVTILGPHPTVSGWSHIIGSLDRGQADPLATTHIVPLAPAQPRSLRRMFHLVNATIAQEDEATEDEESPTTSTEEAVTALGSVESLSSASGLLGDVQIEIVQDIGLIIVKGAKRDVQRALQVIEQIKSQAKLTEPVIEVLQLQFANSEAVADEVNRLYESVYQARQGTVSVTALVQPNALLIIGRKEIVESVKSLISKLDQPLEPSDQLKVIRLKHAPAVDLETRIRDFFVQRPGSDQEIRKSMGTRVRIFSDYRTNALIVQAAPRELAEVEKMVAELDVEDAETENRVQVFRLKHALAEDLQRVIQQIITGQANIGAGAGGAGAGAALSNLTTGGSSAGGGAGQASVPSSRLSIVTVDGGKVDSGVLAGVVVTADPSVNALVVKAPLTSMELLSKLIEQLDTLPSAEARVKIYQLRNSDATTVALTLQNLYGLAPTAGQGSQFSLQNNFVNNLSRSGLTGGGESSLVQLRITPEARTNSVIVSGGEADLRVLEAMILRLDEDVADSRRFEVVWLRNATATNVSDALTTYFQNYFQTQSQLVSSGVISAQEALNRQVLVVPEVATNSLLLSASRELFETAMRLIERMDRRPPMVSIQVMLAQVELDDGFELGAEWGVQDSILYSRGSATAGTLGSPIFNIRNPLVPPANANNLAGQGLSSLGVGRTNADGVGGLVLSASSESIGVLIRALQTANRLQVLNRPHLTTLDSQIASANVGGLVPRVTGISQAQVGVPQQITTTDVEVGLILQIRPRVSPDGLILMEVGVENSEVGDPNAGIPIGFGANGEVIRSPIINQTRADTVVSAYPGQTVVFAGLISKTRGSTRRQIPILGSLPWVGAAFRFDTETENRKELLVVLTPRIVQTDEDYEVLKEVETSRMSWCLADVLNVHGDVGLSGGNGLWGPAKSQVLYPDMPPAQLPDRSFLPRGDYQPLHGQPDGYYQETVPYNEPGRVMEAPTMPTPISESAQQGQAGLQPAVYASSQPVAVSSQFAVPGQPVIQASGQPATGAPGVPGQIGLLEPTPSVRR